MDKKVFLSSLRTTLYPSGLSAATIDVLDRILAHSGDLTNAEVAYCMATTYHEVGPTLQPRRESMNYSVGGLLKTFSRKRISDADARRLGRRKGEKALPVARQREIANILYGGEWGRKNLGNTQPNDGWDFRGGGFAQTTGRANFKRISAMVGYDLTKDPDAIVRPEIAVTALIKAMKSGTYTGKRLSDYDLPQQFSSARAIINADGAVNGAKIARHATAFLNALDVAKRVPDALEPYVPASEPRPEPVAPVPSPAPPAPKARVSSRPSSCYSQRLGSGCPASLSMVQPVLWRLTWTSPNSRP